MPAPGIALGAVFCSGRARRAGWLRTLTVGRVGAHLSSKPSLAAVWLERLPFLAPVSFSKKRSGLTLSMSHCVDSG